MWGSLEGPSWTRAGNRLYPARTRLGKAREGHPLAGAPAKAKMTPGNGLIRATTGTPERGGRAMADDRIMDLLVRWEELRRGLRPQPRRDPPRFEAGECAAVHRSRLRFRLHRSRLRVRL